MKASTDFEQARHPPTNTHTPLGRVRDPAENLEQSGFAGAVTANDAKDFALFDFEGNPPQRPELLRGEQGAWSREHGARSLELGAGSMELGAGSYELGTRSGEQRVRSIISCSTPHAPYSMLHVSCPMPHAPCSMLAQPAERRGREVVDCVSQAVTFAVLVPDRVDLGEVLDLYYNITHKKAGSMEQGAWS
jgi:hypothetical protein